jgi:chaperonin GroES
MKPLYDNIIVVPFEGEEKTAGGVYMPETVEAPPEGEVIAVGPGRLMDDGTTAPMGVKPGDYIIWSKFVGSDLREPGTDRKLIILKERDVLMIVEKTMVQA